MSPEPKQDGPKAPAGPGGGPFAERQSARLIGLILVLALGVRLAALSSLNGSVYGDFLFWDEQTYHNWANNIVEGSKFTVYDQSPLPAYVMAAVYKVLSPDPHFVRLLHVVFGVLTCWFLYRIGCELAGRAAGLLAALVAALYKPFVLFSITLIKESLGLFLVSWALALFLAEMNGHRRLRLLFLGLILGLLVSVRQNAGVLLPVIGVVTLVGVFRERRSVRPVLLGLLLYCAGLLLPALPFMLKNSRDTGRLASTAVGGFNLYLGNYLPNTTAYYRPVPFATSVPREQAIQFTIEASRRAGRRLTPGEASRFWEREVLRSARDRPGAFAEKLAQKTLAVFHRSEEGDNHDLGFLAGFVPFFRLPLFEFWLLMPLGMAGMILALGHDRKTLALALVFLAYAATLVVFFSNMRIRAPLLVILIPCAAAGVSDFVKRGRTDPRRRWLFAAVALGFAVLELLPLAGAGDLTAHYNAHAINLRGKGRVEEAVRYWERSSEMDGAYSGFADLSLAGEALGRNDTAAAKAWLDKIPDGSFAAAYKHELMGDLYAAQGRLDLAAAAYETSLAVNSGQRGTRRKLITVSERIDPARAAAQKDSLRYILDFYKALNLPDDGPE